MNFSLTRRSQWQFEKRICRCCGELKPITKFSKIDKVHRRHVCNECRWRDTIKPARNRMILRALDGR